MILLFTGFDISLQRSLAENFKNIKSYLKLEKKISSS